MFHILNSRKLMPFQYQIYQLYSCDKRKLDLHDGHVGIYYSSAQ